jgi:isopenicillin N synthase-like dioxygenase
MAPSAVEYQTLDHSEKHILVKAWSRPQHTKEDLDWAPLTTIDLSRFDEPGGKQELAAQLYDAVTRVGFWTVINAGIDDEKVLRQFSIGNTFFKQPLEEKRYFPCNFAEGEYFGYRENDRWIGDTGVKENIEMVRRSPSVQDLWLNHVQLNVQKPIEANKDVPKHAIVHENWKEISAFHRELFDKVARKLFILMAIILELPENYLLDAHAYEQEGDDHLRYMIYNVRSQEEWDKAQGYSKGGHTDFGFNPSPLNDNQLRRSIGSLTLLFSQHIAGLQIRTPEGDWKWVKPVEGGITCNAADTLSFLTKGKCIRRRLEDANVVSRLHQIYHTPSCDAA